ncbi:MAG TPA: polyketide synthase dehydratase domain-containing protein, partial [Solirubrobacteraceae bacterium]|nr:polyketide synthase dehydratase domain-containing protein [Solirubrobacteraceae bacterium]
GGEVLVAGSLGVLLDERHPTGGLDAERISTATSAGPMTGRIMEMTLGTGIRVLTELDPAAQAFLHDHRIDGTPVLPGVMGIEGFAEAARVLLPGWEVIALEDVELLAPFKFYRDEPRTIELRAQVRDGGDGTLVADCEMIGRRTLPGQAETETRHFTGRARLAREPVPAPAGEAPGRETRRAVEHDDVYRVYFHGPAYQVLERAWRDDGHVVGALAGDLPPDHRPDEPDTLFSPRLVELCFQTAGIWELGTAARMGLPTHVDRVSRFAPEGAATRLWAVVTPRDGGADAEVVDEDGRVHMRLEGYRTIELPGGVDSDALGAIRTAMADA